MDIKFGMKNGSFTHFSSSKSGGLSPYAFTPANKRYNEADQEITISIIFINSVLPE
ncbi:MAG: hypothetical protein JXQ96_15575 [Cyclobacteriaceae bacterium]